MPHLTPSIFLRSLPVILITQGIEPPIAELYLSLPRTDIPARTTRGRKIARFFGASLCYLVILIVAGWSTLAIYFDFNFPRLRIFAAITYLVVVAGTLAFFKRPRRSLLASLICCAIVIAWWLTLKPSNNEHWQADVSQTPYAEIHGNQVIIHNFRSCDYRTELDYTCQWLTKQVDVSQIRGIDLFMNYWGSPYIAHTIVSFDLGNGDHIAFSIEARKKIGLTYSAIRGFFRQYTLIEVISDERDLVRLRTNYRHGEDLYLYHTRATPEFAHSLFLDYLGFANQLHDHPQWYNAVTRNCTTEIFTFKAMRTRPLDWRILFNGKADEMLYEQKELAGDLPFKELKQRAWINSAAKAADKDPDFSTRIRENRPDFSVTLSKF